MRKTTITSDELQAQFRERMKGRLDGDCDDCALSVYGPQAPDAEGSNWSPTGYFRCSQVCNDEIRAVVQELRALFNVS